MMRDELQEIIEFADSEIEKWKKLAEKPSKTARWDKCFPSQCLAKAKEAGLFRLKALSILGRAKDE